MLLLYVLACWCTGKPQIIVYVQFNTSVSGIIQLGTLTLYHLSFCLSYPTLI